MLIVLREKKLDELRWGFYLVIIQIEGKKRMKTEDLLNGVNLDDYEDVLY